MDTSEKTCKICGNAITSIRNRCYKCTSKKPTGEIRQCKICGKDFRASKWQLDALNNQGVYCSRKCKYEGIRLNAPGCRIRRPDGYIAVYFPRSPMATKAGWVLEHRLALSKHLGIVIPASQHVHHKNGVRDDNRVENLEIISPSVHAGISNKQGASQRAAMKQELEKLKNELEAYRSKYGPLEK